MSKERFDHLLSMIREKITKKNTRMLESISAEERLVITLRYLASGMSQQDLCYSFRIGRITASNIVRDVCVALYEVLSPIYLKPPSTEKEWQKISDDFESLWDFPHCIGCKWWDCNQTKRICEEIKKMIMEKLDAKIVDKVPDPPVSVN